jgi:cytochrome c-type biogenesis protein
MDLVFAYGAGLLTLINPCVLPVLPIVLATALQASRWGPVALAAGMSLSFAILGVTVSAFGRAVGLNADDIAQVGAVLMILFGLVLLVPQTSAVFSTATAGFAARADSGLDEVDRGSLTGQFVGGMLLGAVWSPCVGPTLGGAISLASQGESLLRATAIMLFFALGYGARSALQKRQAAMRRFAAAARPLLGAIFVAVGLMLFFKWHYFIESWLLDIMPIWLQDLSITL